MLRKGDRVKMQGCAEADKYQDKVWICRTDEFSIGTGSSKQRLIFLERFSGYFDAECLVKVEIENF